MSLRGEFNILITAASRRVPLVRGFRRALDELGVRGHVIVTDVNALSPAVQVADRAYAVPLANDPGYIEVMLGSANAGRSICSCRPSTTNCRCSPRPPPASHRGEPASVSPTARPRISATTSWPPAGT